MSDVLRRPDALGQDQLDLYADSVKPGRTGEDLLFQVLLDWGLELTMPIAVEQSEGHELLIVEEGALIACFGAEVSPALVREIARRQPLRAVFADSGFASDSDRINAEQVFTELSPATDVKLVKAYGEKTDASLSGEYNPEPDSGRHERFSDELERMADADRQAILDTADTRL